ncbi:MAG: hypothetical protein M3P84_10425, partial [Chloroflexota bacterium]|nr:hypothetical protein [Chloroflexota bacterium]
AMGIVGVCDGLAAGDPLATMLDEVAGDAIATEDGVASPQPTSRHVRANIVAIRAVIAFIASTPTQTIHCDQEPPTSRCRAERRTISLRVDDPVARNCVDPRIDVRAAGSGSLPRDEGN